MNAQSSGAGLMEFVRLFVVAQAFDVAGQGCILIPRPDAEPSDQHVRIGDAVRLVRPDGRSIDTAVQGVEVGARQLRAGAPVTPLLLRREVRAGDVEPGTQVFAVSDRR